nr:HipA domain-containing protein [Peteryoungia desertarenae]
MTRDFREVMQMVRNMTFNLLARHRDDHARNHAFLMGAHGMSKLAPAYDLTFSSGPGGDHGAAVAGEGRNLERSICCTSPATPRSLKWTPSN